MTGGSVLLQMTASRDAGIWELFMESGPVAKFVLAILAFFSLASWTIMITKHLQLRRAASHTGRFLEVFRRSKRFSEINAVTDRHSASPLVGLFQAGYVEIDAQVKALHEDLAQKGAEGQDKARYQIKSLQGVERSLQRAVGVELLHLSRHTQFLATTAAATPFIGLFGTVWGIMIAFSSIGQTGSASIVAVAPGIAEALINTAAGLVAAIPALIGYNQLSGRLRRLRGEMEDFSLELLNLTERNFT